MKSQTSGSEPAISAEDAARADRLDECIALSAVGLDLAWAGALHRARLRAEQLAQENPGAPVEPAIEAAQREFVAIVYGRRPVPNHRL